MPDRNRVTLEMGECGLTKHEQMYQNIRLQFVYVVVQLTQKRQLQISMLVVGYWEITWPSLGAACRRYNTVLTCKHLTISRQCLGVLCIMYGERLCQASITAFRPKQWTSVTYQLSFAGIRLILKQQHSVR